MLAAMNMLRALAALLVLLPLAAGDVVENDRWYVGHLNDQPAMTMHVVVLRHPDGGRTDRLESRVVIARKLGGVAINMTVADNQSFTEDAQGRITGFRFDHEENGQPTSAVGRIVGREVVSTLMSLGRATEQRKPIPEGLELMGQQRSQELLAGRTWKPGDQQVFGSIVMLGKEVQVMKSTAVFKAVDAAGNLTFAVTMDAIPVPTTVTVDPKGELVGMGMSLGFITIAVKPSDGPVPLVGAELAPTSLVTAKGPAPLHGPQNRFRLPAGATVSEDEFQRTVGGVATVLADAVPTPLADPAPFLKAEAQLETDDEKLRAWVKEAAGAATGDELAERLRLAVRSYIGIKDLSTGDGSALETFRSRKGDCTEHANLLGAALRIAGIPSRVEAGLVYAADFGGWVGHAWNSAYVGGRWIHLDSAYPGIPRSCYLKLGSTSGEWTTTGAAMLGNLAKVAGKEIETLTPAP